MDTKKVEVYLFYSLADRDKGNPSRGRFCGEVSSPVELLSLIQSDSLVLGGVYGYFENGVPIEEDIMIFLGATWDEMYDRYVYNGRFYPELD